MRLILACIVIIIALLPQPAKACGWLDCWFGWTERTEVKAERDRQIAEIESAADERMKQAEIELERVRQQQYESETARAIAIANAEAQVEQYKAMLEALVAEKTAIIQAMADMQSTSLENQAEMGIAAITETGLTERMRIAGGWSFAIILVVAIAYMVGKLRGGGA